jgi:hypothetical protein
MKKVQDKLKECVDSQSLKSLDSLSAQLAPVEPMETEVDIMQVNVDADGPAAAALTSSMNVKGENKVPIKRKSKRKLKIKAAEKKPETMERKQPRYFCKF